MAQNVDTRWFAKVMNVCRFQSLMVVNEDARTTATGMGLSLEGKFVVELSILAMFQSIVMEGVESVPQI